MGYLAKQCFTCPLEADHLRKWQALLLLFITSQCNQSLRSLLMESNKYWYTWLCCATTNKFRNIREGYFLIYSIVRNYMPTALVSFNKSLTFILLLADSLRWNQRWQKNGKHHSKYTSSLQLWEITIINVTHVCYHSLSMSKYVWNMTSNSEKLIYWFQKSKFAFCLTVTIWT